MAIEKTALVTGAEGFIGSHLVKFLQGEGWNVIGAYRLNGSYSFPKLPRLHFVDCDLRNGQRVEQTFREYKPTHVFHLGAQSLPTVSWADPLAHLNRTSWDPCTCLRHTPPETASCRRFSMFECGVWECACFRNSGEGGAAASSAASLRYQ